MASPELERLQQEVEQIRTTSISAAALITGLATQIRASKDDPAALEALANDLDASQKSLADAVAANTAAKDEQDPTDPKEEDPVGKAAGNGYYGVEAGDKPSEDPNKTTITTSDTSGGGGSEGGLSVGGGDTGQV